MMANQLYIRVIPEVLKLDGATTMAAHEFLTTLRDPTLMLSHFEPFTVTIGKGINYETLPDSCRNGTPVFRRPTGGEILPHDQQDVTFAFSCIDEDSKIDIMRATLLAKSWVMDGIDSLGIKTLSNLGTSIFVPSRGGQYRKIAGTAVQAQAKPGTPYLIHGSIFYNPDFGILRKLYGMPKKELQKHFTFLHKLIDKSPQQVCDAVKQSFMDKCAYYEKSFTEEEWAKIRTLAENYRKIEHLKGTGEERKGELCAFTWGKYPERLKHAPDNLKGRTIYDFPSAKVL